jgi:cell division protein FtsQ
MVKILSALLYKYRGFFSSRGKRNGYLRSLEKRHLTFDSAKKAKTSWYSGVLMIKKKILPASRRKSYLSRSEKRLRYGRTFLRIATIFLLVSVTLGVVHRPVIHYVEGLDLFFLKKIDIRGYGVTSPSQIKKIAGLDYTTSMFAVDPDVVVGKLVSHDWIRSAKIKKIWPHDLQIQIQEHKAAALLVGDVAGYEKMVYINSRGERIAPVNPGDDLDFPVITIENGFTGEKKDELFNDAVYFLRLVAGNNPNLPAQSVSEIHLNSSEGIIIRLVDFPFPIYFGEGEVKKKYRQLREVLAVLYKKKKDKTDISQISYIRMEYYQNKVLVAQSNSG